MNGFDLLRKVFRDPTMEKLEAKHSFLVLCYKRLITLYVGDLKMQLAACSPVEREAFKERVQAIQEKLEGFLIKEAVVTLPGGEPTACLHDWEFVARFGPVYWRCRKCAETRPQKEKAEGWVPCSHDGECHEWKVRVVDGFLCWHCEKCNTTKPFPRTKPEETLTL